ncbi:GNAT family N-acetyltransferase [Kitasatospora sp. NPDC017646]|uniref:GNAT family N-acetyltransferase n=1 Tax=Kitasatospora sp. NPDC017646 TaxID=3364024 RepID=UPI0037BDDEFE
MRPGPAILAGRRTGRPPAPRTVGAVSRRRTGGGRNEDGRPVAAAGVHVHSAAHRVAVLGNVVTHPDARGRGLARACVTAPYRRLAPAADHLGPTSARTTPRCEARPGVHEG